MNKKDSILVSTFIVEIPKKIDDDIFLSDIIAISLNKGFLRGDLSDYIKSKYPCYSEELHSVLFH